MSYLNKFFSSTLATGKFIVTVFSLQYDKDASGPINSYLEFGNDNYGMASYTEQSKTVDIKTFLLGSDLREWQKELGLSEFMPLEIYLQHKNRNKVFDSIVYPLSSRESEKDRSYGRRTRGPRPVRNHYAFYRRSAFPRQSVRSPERPRGIRFARHGRKRQVFRRERLRRPPPPPRT